MNFIEKSDLNLSEHLFSSIPIYHNINPLYDQEDGLTLNSLLIHKQNYLDFFKDTKDLIKEMVWTIKTITNILTNSQP